MVDTPQYPHVGFFPALPLAKNIELGDWIIGKPPQNVAWRSDRFKSLSETLVASFEKIGFKNAAMFWHRDRGFDGTRPSDNEIGQSRPRPERHRMNILRLYPLLALFACVPSNREVWMGELRLPASHTARTVAEDAKEHRYHFVRQDVLDLHPVRFQVQHGTTWADEVRYLSAWHPLGEVRGYRLETALWVTGSGPDRDSRNPGVQVLVKATPMSSAVTPLLFKFMVNDLHQDQHNELVTSEDLVQTATVGDDGVLRMPGDFYVEVVSARTNAEERQRREDQEAFDAKQAAAAAAQRKAEATCGYICAKVFQTDSQVYVWIDNMSDHELSCTGTITGLTKSGQLVTRDVTSSFPPLYRGALAKVVTFASDPFVDGKSDVVCH